MEEKIPSATVLCPSAQSNQEGSVIFGVVGGTAAEPRLSYLRAPVPVTPEVLALAEPVNSTEVFRVAASCAGHKCQHFDGSNCQLGHRIVSLLPAVVESLPPCPIRARCRWWRQEGPEACRRCPQIVTDTYNPTETLRQAAAISTLTLDE